MAKVGQVEAPEAARRAGCLVCPNCGDTKFGTTTMPDGALIRTCHGSLNDEEPCGFRWPVAEDHLYCYLPLDFVLTSVGTV
jgi:hypothetical protein